MKNDNQLRPFSPSDYEAFGGAQSGSAELAEYGGGILVLDGYRVVLLVLEDDWEGESELQGVFATRQRARAVALGILEGFLEPTEVLPTVV